jgi:ubiquinol-cytochrome c reductase cytochrome c1 subunit
MVSMFSINPAHHHFKQYYYQEWEDRDRLIHDRIYPTYYSIDEAKNSNGGKLILTYIIFTSYI